MTTTSSSPSPKVYTQYWTTLCQIPAVDSVNITTDSRIFASVSRMDPKANRKNSSLIDVSTGGNIASYINEEGTSLSASPSGARRALFRLGSIDVCDRMGIVFTVDTTKIHGKVLPSSIFGSISWNSTEDKIAYIAEPVYKEAPSFWDDDEKEEGEEEEEKKEEKEKKGDPRTKFHWKEDWGEQLIGFSNPSIYVLDITTKKVTPFTLSFDQEYSAGKELSDESGGASVGQVSWALNGTHLIFTAWKNGPRRLGIIHCTNRRATVWCAEYKAKGTSTAYRCSPDNVFSSVCPRVSPDGKCVVITFIH